MSKLTWGLFLILTFIIALPIGWWGLAKIDFAYAPLHDAMNISQHIEKYAPRNIKQKLAFENTSKAERVALFHGIVEAIQSNGDGLTALYYTNKTDQTTVALLTPAEVIHLRDVAHLLAKLKWLVLGLFVVWFAIILLLWRKKKALPPAKQLVLSALIILIVFGVVLSFGPEAIFNQLHIWIFPNNHQWFFYYEESLMSTMMKAPDLFAYIAAIWGILSLLLTVVLLRLIGAILSSKNVRNRGGVF